MKIRIFKSITLKWWQIGIFKVASVAFGISVGAYWAEFFDGWIGISFTLFVIGWLYLAYVWVKNWNEV